MKMSKEDIKYVSEKANISYFAARKKLLTAEKEHGIPGALYTRLELFKLTDDEFKRNADLIKKRCKNIEIVMENKGLSCDEALDYLNKLKEQHNISLDEFVSKELYKLSENELAAYAEKKRLAALPKGKKLWINRVCEKTGWSYDEAAKKVNRAKTAFGISPKKYYINEMYNMSETEMARFSLRLSRRQQRRNEVYNRIFEICGKSKEDVKQELAKIRENKPGFTIGVNWYFDYGIYELDNVENNEETYRRIETASWLKEHSASIGEKLALVEKGELDYESVSDEIDEFYRVVDSVLSDGKRDTLIELIKYSFPEAETNEKLKHDVSLDMRATELLLKFNPDEYVSFHFYGRSIMEKLEFLSSVYRAPILEKLNPPHIMDLFNNKYSAYKALSSYYGREIALIDGDNAKEIFRDFCSRHSEFVKKNNYDSLGRGIEKIEIKPDTDLDKLYDEITNGGRLVILEEYIKAHEEIKKLNEDSVNTVRIVTFVKDNSAKVANCFMKIGRQGAFVDNGGAGGILVHIDIENGTLDSDGIDEKGIIYQTHPDNGYEFKGIKLPDWESALNLAKEVALEIENARYIGWDFTYTAEGKWIVVEGNAMTQFFAQQATIGRGIKKEFLEETGGFSELAPQTE